MKKWYFFRGLDTAGSKLVSGVDIVRGKTILQLQREEARKGEYEMSIVLYLVSMSFHTEYKGLIVDYILDWK